MTYEADEPAISGTSYTVIDIDGHPPTSLTDFTLTAKVAVYGGTFAGAVLAVDNSGNGAAAYVHTNNADTVQVALLSSAQAGATFAAGDFRWPTGLMQTGIPFYIQLNRTGTAWKARFSFGELWSNWTATVTDSRTITRIGFAPSVYTDTPYLFSIDYFDVT